LLTKLPFRFLILLLAVGLLAVPSRAGDSYRLLTIGDRPVKWGVPKFGTGAVITYRLAAEGAKGGQDNCRRITPVASLLARSNITRQSFDSALNDAFATWESVANVRFVRVASNMPANLTIAAERTPDGIAYTDVTQGSQSSSGVATLTKAVICLNPRQHWSLQSTQKAKTLSYVLAHEIGHALGLDHPGPKGELMSFEYSDTIQTLQAGDIEGVVLLYGAAPQSGAVALNASAKR
jgi:hypothetical protein